MLVSPFDDPRSWQSSLHLPPNAWQIPAEFHLLVGMFGLLILHFSHLHPWHWVPDCLGDFLIKGDHLGFAIWPLVLATPTECKSVSFLVTVWPRYCSIKILAILFWLGPDHIVFCLLLNALDSLEKVADFIAIIYATVAMIRKAFMIICCSLWSVTYLLQSHPFFSPSWLSYAAIFQLLWPVWPPGQDQEITNGHWGTQLDHPSYSVSISCKHIHPCLWKLLWECDTPRHYLSWNYRFASWGTICAGLIIMEIWSWVIYGDSSVSSAAFFHFCNLPVHMVKAKKSLIDIEAHSWTIQAALSLFHVNRCIHVCENLWMWYIKASSILNVLHCQLMYNLWRSDLCGGLIMSQL